MEQKHCGICTSVIERYPCPLCGYNGELEEPQTRTASALPEEEYILEEPPKAAPRKGSSARKPKSTGKKKKKRGSGLVKWLVILLALLVAAMAAAVVLTVHIWQDATCTAPQTCRICRKTQGEPLPHSWVGECLTPGTCSVCGAVQPEAPGHSWQRPDCLTAGTCAVCGAPEPEAPGHDWQSATCEQPESCSRCPETQGNPLGHSWDGVTQPAVCGRCGVTLTPEQQAQSQLDAQSRGVFDRLFAARDWKAVYEAAEPVTPFENGTHYSAYMAAFDGENPELRELAKSDAPQYEVWMGQERIAAFTLRQKSQGSPEWTLGTLTLNIQWPVTATIQAPDGCTVSVNGVFLDDSYIISRADSPAAAFLPEGIEGLQTCSWQVAGLMAEPEIAVKDSAGNALSVSRDAKTGTYRAMSGGNSQITESEQATVFKALETYSGFMINASGARSALLKYFEEGTQTCKNIQLMGSELWMNKDRGHKFNEQTILAFQRYTDDLFAVRASLVMDTTLSNGSHRDYTVTETMFFRQKGSNLRCFAMTNQDVLMPGTAAASGLDDWEKYPDGIRIEEYTGPNFNAHVMLVRDPSRVYLGVSSETGFSLKKAGKRLTEAIVDENAAAAINAGAFYDDGTSDICVGSTPAGLTIYEGKLISNVYTGLVPEKGFCGLDKDNRLVVAETMTEAEAMEKNIVYGCEFGPVLIQDSKINEEAYNKAGYNPRTAVGQREDGTLIFICADGRQAGSLGATYGELIDALLQFGAVNACNMDGGSSTVMLTRDEENGVQFVNSYSVLQSEPRRMPTFWLVRPLEDS